MPESLLFVHKFLSLVELKDVEDVLILMLRRKTEASLTNLDTLEKRNERNSIKKPYNGILEAIQRVIQPKALIRKIQKAFIHYHQK